MANTKTGFNYYTVDTDRYQDIRIKRLKKDFGCNGIAVYDYILCEIYRVRGCFLEWDEEYTAFDVAEYFGIKESVVREIVRYCGSVGLFDKGLLSRGIVTSASIQRRYLAMCDRARRSTSFIPEEYRIIPEECEIIPEESQKVTEESSHKVKYSKEKKRKINSLSLSPSLSSGDSVESAPAEPTDREREDFLKIFFFKNYKNPESQVEMFVNHYKATGWTRSGGAKVTDRSALAMTWEPKDPSQKDRFPHPFMDFWKELYGKLEKVEAARYGLPLMLRGISGVTSMPGGNIVATVSADLRNYLSRATKLLTVTFLKHYPGKELLYNVKE